MWPASRYHGGDNGSTFIQANYYPPSEFLLSTVATSVEETDDGFPDAISLAQNYPNPFNHLTTINFNVSAPEYVRLDVFDLLGRKVATLLDGWKTAGVHSITFDASNLPSNLYLYRLRAGNFTETKRMLLLK